MRSRYLAVLLASLAFTTILRGQDRTKVCGVSPASVAPFDRLHPAQFISVYEVTKDSQYIPIHVAVAGRPDMTHARSQTRVDLNSKLHITYDRAWLAQQHDYETNVEVSADLNGEPIAVPGYAEVGTEASPGVYNASELTRVAAAMCSLQTSQVPSAMEFLLSEIERANRAARNPISDSITLVSRRLVDMRALIPNDSTAREIGAAQATLQRLRGTQQARTLVAAYSGPAMRQLLAALQYADASVSALTAADTFTLDIVARRARSQRGIILGMAKSFSRDRMVLDSLQAVPTKESEWLRAAGETVDRIRFELAPLLQAADNYTTFLANLGMDRDPIALDELRDTDILIDRTKAKVDDHILLTFANAVPRGTNNPRQLTLDIRVRRFGWVSDITDSFLFLRRLGANYQQPGPPSAVTRAEAVIRQGTAAHDTTVTVPLGVNFELTPGASFIWTRYARHWSSALAPSVGLNVSFPKFQTRTYQLTVAAGENRAVTRKDDTTGNTFDIAIGPYVGLFDGAIGITAGRAITAERRPWYFGIGLSFLRLAKNAAKFIPSSQQ